MKKEQKVMHLFAGVGTRNYGRTFLVWGLSSVMAFSAFPIMAETSLGGGKVD